MSLDNITEERRLDFIARMDRIILDGLNTDGWTCRKKIQEELREMKSQGKISEWRIHLYSSRDRFLISVIISTDSSEHTESKMVDLNIPGPEAFSAFTESLKAHRDIVHKLNMDKNILPMAKAEAPQGTIFAVNSPYCSDFHFTPVAESSRTIEGGTVTNHGTYCQAPVRADIIQQWCDSEDDLWYEEALRLTEKSNAFFPAKSTLKSMSESLKDEARKNGLTVIDDAKIISYEAKFDWCAYDIYKEVNDHFVDSIAKAIDLEVMAELLEEPTVKTAKVTKITADMVGKTTTEVKPQKVLKPFPFDLRQGVLNRLTQKPDLF